jgi:cell division protein FtsB
VTVLLAGIVALNVAVLGLNMQLERLGARKEKVQARNAEIDAELAGVAAAGRIEAAARGRLGLVAPLETTYVEVSRRRR